MKIENVQAVIYYNKNTGTFIEFDVEVDKKIAFSELKNNLQTGKSFIDNVLPEILEFGGRIPFPDELAKVLDEESEMDAFLLASFMPAAKEELIKCLYTVVPEERCQTYIEVASNERLYTEAIGIYGLIIYKEKPNGGLLATGITYEELEMNFFPTN